MSFNINNTQEMPCSWSQMVSNKESIKTPPSKKNVPPSLMASIKTPLPITKNVISKQQSLDKFVFHFELSYNDALIAEIQHIHRTLEETPLSEIDSTWCTNWLKAISRIGKHSTLSCEAKEAISALVNAFLRTGSQFVVSPFTPSQLGSIYKSFGFLRYTNIALSSSLFRLFTEETLNPHLFDNTEDLINVLFGMGKCFLINPQSKNPHAIFDALLAKVEENTLNSNRFILVHETCRTLTAMKDYLLSNYNEVPSHFAGKAEKLLDNLIENDLMTCLLDPHICIPHLLYSSAILGVVNPRATLLLVTLLKDEKKWPHVSGLNMLYLVQQRFPKEIRYPKWLAEQMNEQSLIGKPEFYQISDFQRQVHSYICEAFPKSSTKIEHTIMGLSLDILFEREGEKWAIECDGHDNHFNVYGQLKLNSQFRDQILMNLGYRPIHITRTATHGINDRVAKLNVLQIINCKMNEVQQLKINEQQTKKNQQKKIPPAATHEKENLTTEGNNTVRSKRRRKKKSSASIARINQETATSPDCEMDQKEQIVASVKPANRRGIKPKRSASLRTHQVRPNEVQVAPNNPSDVRLHLATHVAAVAAVSTGVLAMSLYAMNNRS